MERSYFNVLQFNYTDIFDRLLEKANLYPDANIHIHGTLSEGIIMGVGHFEQITNQHVREGSDEILEVMVKPNFREIMLADALVEQKTQRI